MTGVTKTGRNQDDIQELNRALIINLLRKSKITSRVELAKKTGLRQTTITNIISEFIDKGLVRETGLLEGKKGRRSIGITLNSECFRVAVVRLSRQYFSLALLDISGNEYSREEHKLDMLQGPRTAMDLIKKSLTQLLQKAENVIALGLAVPGPFLKTEGKIVVMSEFSGWEEINIQKELENTVDVPVYIEHDGNAGALAEWWFGNHDHYTPVMVNILAGQGVGVGIVVNGEIFGGSDGVAGELGHTSIAYDGPRCECGNRGCLDLYCSTIALEREIKRNLEEYPDSVLQNVEITRDNIFKAAASGDELACNAVKRMGRYLSYSVVTVIRMYNPRLIVIGDELSAGGEIFLNEIKSGVEKRILPDLYKRVEIKLSTLDNPILLGVMAAAADEVFKHPSSFLRRLESGKSSNEYNER